MRKTWNEKLRIDREPMVEVTHRTVSGFKAGDRLLLPTPLVVDDYIRKIPPGETSNLSKMREELAKQFGADSTCPLMAGIFTRIVAEAAIEDLASGQSKGDVAPFWRMIGPKDKSSKKLSCGVEELESLRRGEGIS